MDSNTGSGGWGQPNEGEGRPLAEGAHPATPRQAAWQPYGDPRQPPQQPFSPMPAYAAPPQPRKSRAWIVALVAVVLLFALLFFGMASCSRMFSQAIAAGSASSGSELDYVAGDVIGVITIDGTIQYDGTTSSPEGLKEQLDRAAADSRVKAIVLRVDSGGGVATAGEEMAAYVRDCAVPVVVSSASINASAAYEISSQADYIFTAKTTAIGAIGTVMQFTDLSGLYEMLGIDIENVASAESKDSSYGTRPLTDEERAYYQAMVDQINETFLETVAEGRGMAVDEVRALATGMTFTGIDAVENGLADEIGLFEDAVAMAAELGGAQNYTVVDLEPTYRYDLSSLLGLLSTSDASASVEDLVAAIEGKESADGVVSY